MKLLSFSHEKDFGHDFYVMIGRMKKRSWLQIGFGSGVYGFSPRLSVSAGEDALLDIYGSLGKVYFTVELLGHNWKE